MDIVEFLNARLNEDEAVARAVDDQSSPWTGHWIADENDAARTRNGHVLFYGRDGRPLKPGLVAHVVRHDPARVLREVAAKRTIIEQWADQYDDNPNTQLPDTLAARHILHTFASVYADHPDYDPSWAPVT